MSTPIGIARHAESSVKLVFFFWSNDKKCEFFLCTDSEERYTDEEEKKLRLPICNALLNLLPSL